MSEALRLADELSTDYYDDVRVTAAANELRRLHEAHDWQYKMAGERLRRIEKLEALNTELVEALRKVLEVWQDDPAYGHGAADKAWELLVKIEASNGS